MGSTLSHLACLGIAYLYPSYSCYKALNERASNLELVHRLTSWALVSVVLNLTYRVLDPVLIIFIPFYPLLKTIFVFWMVSTYSKGGSVLYIKYVEPAMDRIEHIVEKRSGNRLKELLGWEDDHES